MITLYIVRHGQTVDNLENRIQGHTDSPLTDLGVRQAEAVAERLSDESFTAIYSSDLGRAVRTAEIIASRHKLLVKTIPLVREIYLGIAQGLTASEFAAQYPEEYRLWSTRSVANRPPGAESIEDLTARCAEFIEFVLREHPGGGKIAVIGHSGSQRGLICAALGMPVSYYPSLGVANAALSIVELGERRVLRLYNDTCHLSSIDVTVSDADAV